MAYGKFAPKISNRDLYPYGYGGRYGNSWDDIGYALGAALGNLWGANYNERGVAKGEAEAQKAMQEAYNKVYGAAQPAPESLQTQYQDATASMGLPQGQQAVPNSNDNTTYIDSTKKYLGGNNSKGTGNTMKDMTPQRDINAEKYDNFLSKYNSGTPNPDGDAQKVDALTQAANGNLANLDFSKLPSMSAADLQSAIRKELRANGRTDYQINKVLENLSPTIKAKVQEGNNINFGNLYDQLNQQIKNGELDAANLTLAKMSELNPKMAAALQPKMKRAWDAYNLDQNFQTKFNFYKQDPNLTEQQAYNMARYNSVFNPVEQANFLGVNGSGKTKKARANTSANSNETAGNGFLGNMFGGYDLGNNNFKYMDARIKELGDKEDLTPAEEQELQDLKNSKEDAEIVSGVRPVTPQWVARKADNVINASNGNDAFVEAGLAEMFGRGSYMYNVGMQRLQVRRAAQKDTNYDVDLSWDAEASKAAEQNQDANKKAETEAKQKKEYDYAYANKTGAAKWLDDKTKKHKKQWDDMTVGEMVDAVIKGKLFG